MGAGLVQAPAPLHVDAAVYRSATQISPAQTVLAGYSRHSPVPLHLPSVPQLAAVMSAHIRRGSGAPTATELQRPKLPAMEQLRHAPTQAVLQQMPPPAALSLTQFRLRQSWLAVQAWPSSLGPQLLFTQAIPSAQSADVTHLELQRPFAHR